LPESGRLPASDAGRAVMDHDRPGGESTGRNDPRVPVGNSRHAGTARIAHRIDRDHTGHPRCGSRLFLARLAYDRRRHLMRTAIQVERLEKRYRVWTQSRPTNLKERVRLAISRSGRDAEKPWQDIEALRGV